ncbi:glycine zipper 2TM domain-containing protein [Sphingobium boeckii]|uniref:17 kDa surface antigen n=1 Tax=Sphingobium boeckii TaxID=1082345 RepID=A0A7W9AF87_9SPHN|nr:glycine zipper 2TM domain-containing protein [Sphingobium boeckii]MBB5684493.1 hypothetical protein [Sphingobium boeckii]
MFKKLSLITATLAMGAATLVPAAPAMARDHYRGGYDNARDYRGDRGYRNDRRGYRGDRYNNRGYRNDYRNNYRCNNSGTTGTIIGAIAGGLLGREVVGRRGDRTAGLIIGGGAGALAGRAIDKNGSRC